jgi:hypothetical protein
MIAFLVWFDRRRSPLLATAGLIAVGMFATTWGSPLTRTWEAQLTGKPTFALPADLWPTLVAARRLLHLDLGGLYTAPTALVSFPGTALILVPVAALIEAAGLGLATPSTINPHPGAWLLAGPYEMALSGVALLAADSIAERLDVAPPKRALLATTGAVALGNVSLAGGHPEDAVAVGLFLAGILALSSARGRRSAWLVGAAVAVQPLVLLALPIILAVVEPRLLVGYVTRVAAPAALLVGIAAAANSTATFRAVTSQPNWPSVDHTTPWVSLVPHMSGGAVSAGPARVLAIVVACGCAIAVRHRWLRARRASVWSPEFLQNLLWWVAAALAIRCAFEPVIVAYYLWPALAVALVTASTSWSRLIPTSLAVTALTFSSGAGWQGPWTWWVSMTAGLSLTLFLARIRPHNAALPRADAARSPLPTARARSPAGSRRAGVTRCGGRRRSGFLPPIRLGRAR